MPVIVDHEDLPAEFVDDVKVKIVRWRPVMRRIDGLDVRVLEADWTLVPKDWPGEGFGALMPGYPASSFEANLEDSERLFRARLKDGWK
jgi:hypothetical protein